MARYKRNVVSSIVVETAVPYAPENRRERLGELALLFLRLGTVAFGGPAAHIEDGTRAWSRIWLPRAGAD